MSDTLLPVPDDWKRRAFLDAFTELSTRIRLFLNLPLEKLERQSLQDRLRDIGKAK